MVKILNGSGHEAVPHSPSTGLDLLSGQGLPEALAGADVVVNLTNSPTFDEASPAFFQKTMDNLLAAAEAAGVGHAVILSIVGADQVPGLVYEAHLTNGQTYTNDNIAVFEFRDGKIAVHHDYYDPRRFQVVIDALNQTPPLTCTGKTCRDVDPTRRSDRGGRPHCGNRPGDRDCRGHGLASRARLPSPKWCRSSAGSCTTARRRALLRTTWSPRDGPTCTPTRPASTYANHDYQDTTVMPTGPVNRLVLALERVSCAA